MTKSKSLLAALLATVSLSGYAEEWNMVSSSAEAQVFVDSQSLLKGDDNLFQVRILENFADTTNMGHGFYEHKSRYILMAVNCEAGAVSYQQWSMHADALGSGATVWADSMRNGPAFFRPDSTSGYAQVVSSVCNAPIASAN